MELQETFQLAYQNLVSSQETGQPVSKKRVSYMQVLTVYVSLGNREFFKVCKGDNVFKVSSQSRKSEIRVFNTVHLNIYNFRCTQLISTK